jgi:hypothetical protein
MQIYVFFYLKQHYLAQKENSSVNLLLKVLYYLIILHLIN